MKNIYHLAAKAESYAVGAYLILQFGKGTQVCRIEGETKARYTIRRLQARATEHANWDYLTSQISKVDPRILGELPADRLAAAQVPACPTLAAWVEELEAAAERLIARAGEAQHGEWYAKRDEKQAAAYRKEAAMIAKLMPAEAAIAAQVEPEAQVEEDDLPAIEAPELPAVAPVAAAQLLRDAAANPTRRQYGELDTAYDFFNQALFNGELPRCLITMQRHAKAFGFFHGNRFTTLDGKSIADEIALNPEHLRERSAEASLATLVHEMAHLWDHHHGEPARAGYHGKTWAAKMEEVGLMPSSTAAPGGKRTGQKVSHYIIEGGPFQRRCAELLSAGWEMPYVQTPQAPKQAKAKKASKTKYSCPCCSANAWAKPAAKLICGECEEVMLPEEQDAETAPEEELEEA